MDEQSSDVVSDEVAVNNLSDSSTEQSETVVETGDNTNNSQENEGQPKFDHPRLLKLNQKFKEAAKERDILKQQLEELQKQYAKPQEQSEAKPEASKSKYLAKYGIKPFKAPNEYMSIDEIFDDIKDRDRQLTEAEKAENERLESQKLAEQQERYIAEANEAKEMLGEDYDAYTEFVKEHYEKNPDSKMGLMSLAVKFLRSGNTKEETVPQPAKAGSKINTSSKNAVSRSKDINSVSDADIANEIFSKF